MENYYLTAESVTPGHPDKIADAISDAVLDKVLEQDKSGRVACEVLVGKGYVMVSGEITTTGYVDIQEISRETIRKIGYTKPEYGFDFRTVAVFNVINEQSPDIAQGVKETGAEEQGAGDQGAMIGYASKETKELMPLPIILAHKLVKQLVKVREEKVIPYLRPDGKSQVIIEYQDNKPKRLDSVIIAAQHDSDVEAEKIQQDIIAEVIKPICSSLLDNDTKYYINNTGRFVIGGPVSDSGMTGRKNVVDAYGPQVPTGGGAFSGKDPTKVDRSAAYMARYIAKNIVATDLVENCKVELSYAIGSSAPVSINIQTSKPELDEKFAKIVPQVFDLTPAGIIKELNLLEPIYSKTTCFGHFGRENDGFNWEKKDKTEKIIQALNLV